jgi:hypothetical protein
MRPLRPGDSEPRLDEQDFARAAAEVQHVIAQLEQAISVLPPVDQDGHSPSPDAEVLYARKDQCVAELADKFRWLQDLLVVLDCQIQRYGDMEGIVTSGAGKLHNDQAKGFFNEAGELLDLKHSSYKEIRAAIVLVLHKAEAAMEKAMNLPKYSPPSAGAGRRPLPPAHPAAPAPCPGAPPAPWPAPPGSVRYELDDLYSIDDERSQEA